jgi:mono/diheme cytochrome c family protein
MKKLLVLFISSIILAACNIFTPGQNFSPGPMMDPGNNQWGNGRYESNGERIYFTATNDQGDRIRYSGGQTFGGMMGGGALACASCHGPNARGGTHTMHMDVMDAPDIRFSALSDEAGETDEHGDEHAEYNLSLFRQAVMDGKHPDGDELSRDMPRWKMSDDDLEDLFEYLKSLP